MNYQFFAPCPLCMEDLLQDELHSLGIRSTRITQAGVSFRASLGQAYRVCLWSRTASRVYLSLATFNVENRDDLYREALRIRWSDHMNERNSFRIDSSTSGIRTLNNNFAALVLKDAICDYFRKQSGRRPAVQCEKPDIAINLHISGNSATISLDFAGESLHKRRYRNIGLKAPLKENVAAAMLLRAGWPEIAGKGGSFIDPMCGSGTILIEAAMMAGGTAPGLFRDYYGCIGLQSHDAEMWNQSMEEAKKRYETGKPKIPLIRGYDCDQRAVDAAREHCAKAGFSDIIVIEKRNLSGLFDIDFSDFTPGLIAVNPPYGHRLDKHGDLLSLYENLGRLFSKSFPGWKASVLTGHQHLAKSIGLRASKINTIYNGTIKCTLALFEMNERNRFVPLAEKKSDK
ncbi:MAG: hypothetical protein JW881_21460 [Spirochaetales bacterium]|nr:hypothetical protein [Spirochaetales bacterium]